MDSDTSNGLKSVSCTKLPEAFMIDKQESKKFFSQYGNIRRFILYPSRCECVVEYETTEGAQNALNAKVDFLISPADPARQSPKNEYFLDPDVQSELNSMMPAGLKAPIKPQAAPAAIESSFKNPPQSFFKPSKTFTTIKAKTEPLTVQTSHADPRQVQMARNELENLCKKPAKFADEKFAILDARDKLYRLITTKPADIRRHEVAKGTCPDMCPEKERLMREARLQVASFEFDENGEFLDPTRAIKQYSRSSADQETPLPHELRPESVLKTTMTYILHNIMNLADDENTSMSDWFHFIWDRTRGIRKDITQQELCSPTSVELIEQCTRFHIHCSARLIEEEPSVFDRKINDENLTKSLQTLKYMYDDLKMKKVKCGNEAEFRAYVVLLNLNDPGNFLWEIKQLEKDILKSKEVRFALQVYFAVSLNNYVKFFNLLKEASYMNACIMLRYFTQIRIKASSIIIRSYVSRRGQGVNITLSYLTEILAFEDDDATANFMTYHGATCDKENDNVNIDSRTFGNPEVPWPMERALEMVESKLEVSVAEAICGSELPDPECFLNFVPHVSFNESGFLKKESFYAEDQNGPLPVKDGVFKVPRESPPVSPVSRNQFQPKSKPDQPDGSKNVFAKANPFETTYGQTKVPSIFGMPKFLSSSSESSPTNPSSVFNKAQECFGAKAIVSLNPFGKPITTNQSSIFNVNPPQFGSNNIPKPDFSFTQVVQQSAIQKEQEIRKRLEEEQRKRLLEEEEIRKEKEAREQELRELEERRRRLEEEAKKQAQLAELKRIQDEENKKRELEKLRLKKLHDDSQAILDSLIHEIVSSHVTAESKIAVKIYVELPRDFYDALEHDTVVEELFKIYNQELTCYVNSMRYKYRTLSKFFSDWRTITEKQIEKRRKLSNIGCMSLNQSLEEHASAVYHPQQKATLSNMKQYLAGTSQNINLPNLDVYRQIDLFKDLKMATSLPDKFYWKIIVSVPLRNEENCSGFSSFIKKWLTKTFNVKENEDIFYLEKRIMRQTMSMASICMRKIQGIEAFNEKNEKSIEVLNNANSVQFFCTTANMAQARKRLQKILNNLNHPVSVSIVVYKNLVEIDDEALIAQHMDLKKESNVIDFEINLFYECHEKMKDLTDVVLESCCFLCESFANQLQKEDVKIFDLEMQQIHDFFLCCLGDEMWQRIENSCRDSKEFNKHLMSFNNVIHVYNECIDKIIEIVDKDFGNLPTLSSEFRKQLPAIEPRIPNSFEYFPEDWKSAGNQKSVKALLRDMKMNKMVNDNFRNFNDYKDKLDIFLKSNMPAQSEHVFNAVIEKVINGFYRLQLQSNDFSNDFVVHSLEKLRWMEFFGDIVVGRFNEVYQRHKHLPSFVVYYKRDFRCYRVPWWYKINFPNTTEHSSSEPSKKRRKTSEIFDKNDFEALLKKGVECSKKVNDIISKSRQNLSQTRVDSKTFDQYLDKCEEKFRGMQSSLGSMILNE